MDIRDIADGAMGTALLLRAREVQTLLGLSRSKVYELMQAGELPTVRVGRAVRVPRDGLAAWLRRQSMVDGSGAHAD